MMTDTELKDLGALMFMVIENLNVHYQCIARVEFDDRFSHARSRYETACVKYS